MSESRNYLDQPVPPMPPLPPGVDGADSPWRARATTAQHALPQEASLPTIPPLSVSREFKVRNHPDPLGDHRCEPGAEEVLLWDYFHKDPLTAMTLETPFDDHGGEDYLESSKGPTATGLLREFLRTMPAFKGSISPPDDAIDSVIRPQLYKEGPTQQEILAAGVLIGGCSELTIMKASNYRSAGGGFVTGFGVASAARRGPVRTVEERLAHVNEALGVVALSLPQPTGDVDLDRVSRVAYRFVSDTTDRLSAAGMDHADQAAWWQQSLIGATATRLDMATTKSFAGVVAIMNDTRLCELDVRMGNDPLTRSVLPGTPALPAQAVELS